MVKGLTQHQLEIITNLFHAVDGQAYVFIPADNIHPTSLFWLEHPCRGLITIKKRKKGRKITRKIALTDNGLLWCEQHGIYAREPIDEAYVPKADKRTRVTIAFQLPIHDRAGGLIEMCKEKRDFVPLVRLAMELYAAIGMKGLKQLVASHADEIGALQVAHHEIENERQRITLEKAALDKQSQEVQQFQGLFSELETIKRLLKDKPQSRPNAPNSRLQPVSGSIQASGELKAIGGLKPIAAPNPEFNDDEDEGLFNVATDSENSKRIGENFIKSAFGTLELKSEVDPKALSGRQREMFNE